MVINISINKTLDDSVIVEKVLILWFSYLCSRGFSQGKCVAGANQ